MTSRVPMTRAAEMLTTIAIQGVGSVAMFATIAVVARTLGPPGQGAFSIAKAEVDFLAAVALMGMPQALFYFLRSGRKSIASCVTLVIAHALIAIPVISLWIAFSPNAQDSSGRGIASLSILTATVAFSVAYGDLRALMLATHSSMWFSVISAAPNIILLSIVGVSIAIVPGESIGAVVGVPLFFATYGLALAIAAVGFMGRVGGLSTSVRELLASFRELVPFGILTWIPAVLQTALVLFVLRWVGSVESGPDAAGAFATALTLSVIATTPLSLAIPLLFKWWMPLDDRSRRREVWATILWATAIVAAMWFVVWQWEMEIVRTAFGPDFVKYTGLYSVLFLATAPQVALKVFGVFCNASGRPVIAAIVEGVRAVLIVGAIVAMGTTLETSVFAWVTGEFAALLICAIVFWMLPAQGGGRA